MIKLMKKGISLALVLVLLLAFLPVRAAADASSWVFGKAQWYSVYGEGKTIDDTFYYRDAWFFEDSSERNDELALISMQLTAAAADASADGLGAEFLKKLGFSETGYVSDEPTELACCNYTYGKKTISQGGKEATLVAVLIESYSFDAKVKTAGWTQNFLVNAEGNAAGEHYGFSSAAKAVLPGIAGLGGSGNVKYWIAGQSRAGALANLIAAKLPETAGVSGKDIYAYTFETPAFAEANAAKAKDYGYIHNYICSDDLVTQIPPWQMSRYGNVYTLDTAEADAALTEELKKFDSLMVEQAQALDKQKTSRLEETIVAVLMYRIPRRADYTLPQVDRVKAADGSEVVFEYTYQDLFRELMKLLFGGSSGIDTDALSEHLEELGPTVITLTKAVDQRSDQVYYEASQSLWDFLSKYDISLGLSEAHLFALLRLAGPLLVDPDVKIESEKDFMDLLKPLFELVAEKDRLTFSHHFDTIIARLKALAPAPTLISQDIKIPTPKAGDSVDKAAKEIADWAEGVGSGWLLTSASWQSKEETLAGDRMQYLDVVLEAIGHETGKQFTLTLNGKEPVEGPVKTYEKGVVTIRATWAIPVGKPGQVEISFHREGHGEEVEPIRVDAGTRLKYAAMPDPGTVTEEDGTWFFKEWETTDGVHQDDIVATEDLEVHARWLKVVDRMELTFPYTHIGDTVGEVTVPENEYYEVKSQNVYDEDYNDVSVIEDERPLILGVELYLPAKDAMFLVEYDEYDAAEYIGKAFVNGQEAESSFDESENTVYISYHFTPIPGADSIVHEFGEWETVMLPTQSGEGLERRTCSLCGLVEERAIAKLPIYTVTDVRNPQWRHGSTENVVLTVKRDYDDENCISYFSTVLVDGKPMSAEDYYVIAGSTVVTMKPSGLEKLTNGNHTVEIRFRDGQALAYLDVLEGYPATPTYSPTVTVRPTGYPYNPTTYPTTYPRPTYSPVTPTRTPYVPVPTGDDGMAGLWIFLEAAALAGIVGILKAKA